MQAGSGTPVAPQLERGCRVAGRYHVDEPIRADPSCVRYLAYDEAGRRWVHLILRPSPTVRDARLVHEGIAQPVDLGCIGSWFVSVLDPGPGESLQRLVARLHGAPIDLDSLMLFGLGMLETLAHVGRWSLAHGNLSPDRIHITPEFDPVLLGFEAEGRLPERAMAFAAPERHEGHVGDGRSDIYAVGALLYTLRTGLTPFGRTGTVCREGHLYDPVPPSPHLSPPLFDVLQTAMAKRPDDRFQSAQEFMLALSDAYHETSQRWMRDLPVDTENPEPPDHAFPLQGKPFPPTDPDASPTALTTDEHTGFDLELPRPQLGGAGPLVFADDPTHEELVEAALIGTLDLDSSLDPDPISIHDEDTLRLDVPTDALPLLQLDETSELTLGTVLGYEAVEPGGRLSERAPMIVPGTLDPAPVRRYEPDSTWGELERTLPQILLVVLCALGMGVASAAVLVALLIAQLF